jgi:positive regulator of sigma E activity
MANGVNYDAQVIVAFAERLYRQAATIAATYALLGALVGAAIGAAVGNALGSLFVVMVLGAVLVGALAFAIGQQKAFALKLQAQVALCQVQIEDNTHRS